ncbi:MAG: hypothetical protein FWG84_10640 [Bacteroidales bacterium]|nr:hypothetical protein [Bacteroidales bacterium]
MKEETLSKMCLSTQSTMSRALGKPDIDTELLIRASYALNYDFLRNVYLPYMAVNENEIIANGCIAAPCVFTIEPKMIEVVTEKQEGFYSGMWVTREPRDVPEKEKSHIE